MDKVYLVYHGANPHIWHSGDGRIVAVFACQEDADEFVAQFPDKQYQEGKSTPAMILTIKEYVAGYVCPYFAEYQHA